MLTSPPDDMTIAAWLDAMVIHMEGEIAGILAQIDAIQTRNTENTAQIDALRVVLAARRAKRAEVAAAARKV